MTILIAVGTIIISAFAVTYYLRYKEVIKHFNPYGLQPEGVCPVQIEHRLSDGNYLYFRARYTGITVEVHKTYQDFQNGVLPLFAHHLSYGTDYEAGYISHFDAIRLCTVWITEYFTLKTKK